MAGKRPLTAENRLIDAISTLKRATGISSAPKLRDSVDKMSAELVNVYTTDRDSAQILSNVLTQCVLMAMGITDGKKFAREEKQQAYHLAEIVPLKGGCFQVKIECPPVFALSLADAINARVGLLISPDKPIRSR